MKFLLRPFDRIWKERCRDFQLIYYFIYLLSLYTVSLRCLLPSFIPSIRPFWRLVIVKNKLTSVFYGSVLLLMINCGIVKVGVTTSRRRVIPQ